MDTGSNTKIVWITNGVSDPGCIVGDAILDKCFLCDHDFVDGEEPYLMFENRLSDCEGTESSLSVIISSALGRDIIESEAHSTLLCAKCQNIALEYDRLMQRFCEARFRILNTYNQTAQRYDIDTIAVEINGVLRDTNATDLITTSNEKEFPLIKSTAVFSSGLENFELQEYDGSIGLVEKVADDVVDVSSMNNTEKGVLESDTIKSDFATLSSIEDDSTMTSVPLDADLSEDINADDIIAYDDIIEQISPKTSAIDENIDSIIDSSQSTPLDGEHFSYHTNELITADYDDTASSSKADLLQSPMIQQKGDKYCCLACEPHEYLPSKLFTEHMLTVHNTSLYICDECNVMYLKQDDLESHIKSKHIDDNVNVDSEEATKFECDSCKRTFTNYRMFRAHIRLHEKATNSVGGGSIKHECVICHKKYSTKTLLEEHMNMHTGARPYQCEQCPKNFASRYTLQAHMKIHTDRQRPYQCDVCDKKFLNQTNLTQHKKLHVNTKSYICDFCSKAFSTQHNLGVHMITHTGLRPFICRTCGKAFARRAEVRDHERIHTGEKPFSCDLCGMAFTQRSNLLSHKKSTHFNERLHKCDECNRTFKRRRLLEYHINGVHKGIRPFKCEICTAAFVYPEHFKKHMMIHTGKKPYACEVCGKEFNSSDNRNAHRFVHSDKKPYECLECGAGFMRKPLLLAHMKHTNHANDTFIVNQPQITKPVNLASGSRKNSAKLRSVDAHYSDNIMESVEIGSVIVEEESIEAESFERMMESVVDILPNIENDEHQEDNILDGVNGQLIKDQLGEVKYLQFEDLDRDGHEMLTWVDIAGDKD